MSDHITPPASLHPNPPFLTFHWDRVAVIEVEQKLLNFGWAFFDLAAISNETAADYVERFLHTAAKRLWAPQLP